MAQINLPISLKQKGENKMAAIKKKMSSKPTAVSQYVDRGPSTSFGLPKVKIGGNGKTSKKLNIYKK